MPDERDSAPSDNLRQGIGDLTLASEILQQLSASLRDVLWIASPDSAEIYFVSHAYEEVWGRSRQSLCDDPRQWMESAHPQDREEIYKSKEAGRKSGQPYSHEYRIVRPDGTIRWVIDRVFPIRDHAGHIKRLCGIAQDITEKKELERTERKLKEQQDGERLALMQQREDFMAALTHDLKNPLVGSRLVLDQLLAGSDGVLDKSQVDLLFQLRRSNGALLLLIQNLIEVYRYEKDPNFLGTQSVDLVEVTSAFQLEFTPFGSRLGIALRYDIPESPVTILGDEHAMRRVIQNLVDNAIKFTPSGGEVSISLRESGDSAEIVVTDGGPGISKQDQQMLFKRFWQSGEQRHHSGGSGLGLYLSARFVEAHKGTIWCESTKGAGTKFTVRIPLLK